MRLHGERSAVNSAYLLLLELVLEKLVLEHLLGGRRRHRYARPRSCRGRHRGTRRQLGQWRRLRWVSQVRRHVVVLHIGRRKGALIDGRKVH